jgi:hypothetical protein
MKSQWRSLQLSRPERQEVLPLPRDNGPFAHQYRQQRIHPLLSRLPPSTRGCHLNPSGNLRSLRADAAPPHRTEGSFSPLLRHAGRVLEFGPQKSKAEFRDKFRHEFREDFREAFSRLVRAQSFATWHDSGMSAAATSQSSPAFACKPRRHSKVVVELVS